MGRSGPDRGFGRLLQQLGYPDGVEDSGILDPALADEVRAHLVEPDIKKYTGIDESSLVLITENHPILEEPTVKAVGKPIPVAGDRDAWTDDYSHMLRILKEEGRMKFIPPILKAKCQFVVNISTLPTSLPSHAFFRPTIKKNIRYYSGCYI